MPERFVLSTYIGDAVYALFDGRGIMLRLNDHRNEEGEIYLEPEVLEALNRFHERCNKACSGQNTG